MNCIQQADELVKEYLLFRGFLNTYRTFEADLKADKDKGFQVEKLIDELFGYVQAGELTSLLEFWRYLNFRFFTRLDTRFYKNVKKYEACLLKYYLIYGTEYSSSYCVQFLIKEATFVATQQQRKDKILEFFEVFGGELVGNPDWDRWFSLPFVKKPESDPFFQVYFVKSWLETFTVSLSNFLNTIFQNMPLPGLLCFNIDRLKRKALQCEIEALQNVIEHLKLDVETGDSEITALRQKVAQTRSVTPEMPRVRSRAASTSSDRSFGRSGAKERSVSDTIRVPQVISAPGDLLRRFSIRGFRSSKEEPQSTSPTPTPASKKGSEAIREEFPETIMLTNEDAFLEHTSAVTLAKFSYDGSLVCSCDSDNIVRVWSHNPQSNYAASKMIFTTNISAIEWEAKSERMLFLGNEEGQIRAYSTESKNFVHDFVIEGKGPRVNRLAYSPSEPLLLSCITRKSPSDTGVNDIILWNTKSLQKERVFDINTSSGPINTACFNHNGRLILTGDSRGTIRVFDSRTLTSAMEWKTGDSSIFSAQFGFDENTVYSVDSN
ncbi:hypothetical protein K7432_015260, partial [Basidiobolus ranarum]